jgi:hypothetical protein
MLVLIAFLGDLRAALALVIPLSMLFGFIGIYSPKAVETAQST